MKFLLWLETLCNLVFIKLSVLQCGYWIVNLYGQYTEVCIFYVLRGASIVRSRRLQLLKVFNMGSMDAFLGVREDQIISGKEIQSFHQILKVSMTLKKAKNHCLRRSIVWKGLLKCTLTALWVIDISENTSLLKNI